MSAKIEIIYLSLTSCILLILGIILQYNLFSEDGSLAKVNELYSQMKQQQDENIRLKNRNANLATEIHELKYGYDLIEERARFDLGLIKQGETLYIFAQ